MTRTLAFLAASACAAIAVTSACFARGHGANFSANDIQFTLAPANTSGDVQLSLRTGESNNSMSNHFAPAALAGLDLAALRNGGAVRFALIRDAGRVDCAGQATRGRADGNCRFTEDAAFARLLASQGIRRATSQEAFALTLVGATRDLVNALQAAHYPRPTVEKLTELAAVGVDRRFIDELSRRGYRPADLQDLVEFGALDVTPDYIDGMSRAGFKNLDAEKIVEFKALGVSPAYIAELARMGYSDLSASDVTQMKALEITPTFVQGFEQIGYRDLSVDTLVQLKALDITPDYVSSLRQRGLADLSTEQIVALRAIGDRHVRK